MGLPVTRGLAAVAMFACALAVAAGGLARAADPPQWDCQKRPGTNEPELSAFLNNMCHVELGWVRDKSARLAGPVVDDVYYGVHGAVWAEVFYSPEVHDWLKAGRPADQPLPTGSLIVKQQYAYEAGKDTSGPLEGWTIMLKDREMSFDGWYWAYIGFGDDQWDDGEPFLPYCVACHASADNPELTFSSLDTIAGHVDHGEWTPPPPVGSTGTAVPTSPAAHVTPGGEVMRPQLSTPLGAPDPAFVALYAPHRVADKSALRAFPPSSDDHVVAGPEEPPPFVTSDVCGGCHDSGSLLAHKTPDMMVNINGHNFNVSPYGEWSASMMGLGGRDPVFHAQLESERALHPELADLIDDKCFSCHGVMGKRQLELDTEEDDDGPRLFTHDMVYARLGATDGTYGALARDGISCAVCHHITPEELGEPETYTGNFYIGWSDEVYGPYADVKPYSMENALGIAPRGGRQIRDPALCGSCHTVMMPVFDTGQKYAAEDFEERPTAHEQSTYLEWRNSGFWDADYTKSETTCQGCHMRRVIDDIPPFTPDNPLPLSFRIANIETPDYPAYAGQASDDKLDIAVQEPYARHTLAGINLVVKEMFQQFSDVLGISLTDVNISSREHAVESLALAAKAGLHEATQRTARVAVRDLTVADGALTATVRIDNLVGHKFPSGVGFRRAFLEFRVEDANGAVLWASGRPDALGVIAGADGAPLATEFSRDTWQPHFETITAPDQAQIYEERHRDSAGQLTTSFLALAEKVKDTRLLPRDWQTADAGRVRPEEYTEIAPCLRAADGAACAPLPDPDYRTGGGDTIVYRVPLDDIAGAARVVARLHYQAIPPYYLRDRFEGADGPETKRLYYIASHLDLAGLPVENWVLTVAETQRALP